MSAYARRLEMDPDGTVTLIDPIGPDDDSECARLGHVASPRTADACPPELEDDLDRLYRDYVADLEFGPGGLVEFERVAGLRQW